MGKQGRVKKGQVRLGENMKMEARNLDG